MISKLNKAIATGVALAMLAWTPGVAGDVNSSMDSFFDNSLVMSNVTGPTAYKGQKMGYYSAGNISVRTPQMTSQVSSVQLPSVRAGCGGIDVFGGSFSFISSDQLIATMKATASNAAGYVFLLALKSLSPVIANQLETLQDWAQKANAMNINSCEAAQKLVGSTFDKIDGASNKFCTQLGRENGTYSDAAAAKWGCAKSPQKDLDNVSAAQKEVIPINTNLAWEAVKKQALFSSNKELGELAMTLTGSVIYSCPGGSAAGGCTVSMLPAAALDEGTLTAILDGGTVKVHQCDEQVRCLNPTQFTKTITIAPSAAFKWQVQTMLLSITDKIRNKQPLTAQEQSFLGMVSLPVHKMMAVQVAYNKQGADAAIAQYAEVIALDMTYGWVTQVVNELQRGASNLQNVDADKLSDWNRSVAEARTSLLTKQGQVQVRATAMQAFVANVQVMESVVGSRLANRVGASIAFASNMKQ